MMKFFGLLVTPPLWYPENMVMTLRRTAEPGVSRCVAAVSAVATARRVLHDVAVAPASRYIATSHAAQYPRICRPQR